MRLAGVAASRPGLIASRTRAKKAAPNRAIMEGASVWSIRQKTYRRHKGHEAACVLRHVRSMCVTTGIHTGFRLLRRA